ncbi:2-oxoadipate dehydrogenase complex component E1-like [Artemia franciscana]|uniref:Transketolase-like pyrimidine-binding domain-containing protein n=1 Tax=Artemia franciscana TaxID=6661 RepID=A0AA88L5S4_ARTSF|nr:hypothetical protein QYM36_006658 [Artemia franciscana]
MQKSLALCQRTKNLICSTSFYHSKTPIYGARVMEVQNQAIITESDHRVFRLVDAFVQKGHIYARIDPLQEISSSVPVPLQLHPEKFHINSSDTLFIDGTEMTAFQFAEKLSSVFCGNIGFEFGYVEDDEKRFLLSLLKNKYMLNTDEQRGALEEMLKSQVFDQFLSNKFPTVKRYGGEGAESMMPFFMEIFKQCSIKGVTDVVCGMPHRGRLNFLTGILNFPPELVFRKIKGHSEFPENFKTIGDVLSHLSISTDIQISHNNVHFTLIPNPSHLEAINPVVVGKTRSKQQSKKSGSYSNTGESEVLCLQVHGDAALAGQGIIQETLALSRVPHYTVGGSIHLVINNQIGYTTPGDRTRSSRYATDIAKMIEAPVLHVNGDDPEAVIKSAIIAADYHHEYKKDIFIDLICYRRWGHNELDDPTFTNPEMYKLINNRETIPDKYAKQLIDQGIISKEEVNKIVSDYNKQLNKSYKNMENFSPPIPCFSKQWQGIYQSNRNLTQWDTGIEVPLLKYIGSKSCQYPNDFHIHPHLLKTHIKNRLSKVEEGLSVDWATAEALAVGSLLCQGFDVRISGQDVGRGTFSHRHAMLVDQTSGQIYIPLNELFPNQKGHLEIANSILSEEAVLGFEYGMSIERPDILVIWEAQFGDFFNGAQIIIDTFLSSGEAKWLLQSGITILLPHGYDGAGPEHSSCRIERFLQLTDSSETQVDGDDVNLQIANPTTSAQYFHLLRRQMLRSFRKPLIIASPKTLLRLPSASSTLQEMSSSSSFKPVIGDETVSPQKVTKVIFVCGKHYYALADQREKRGIDDIAIIRVEELCPFPTVHLQGELKKYPKAQYFIWNQEEPRNMGAWSFVSPRFENLVGKKLDFVGRKELPAPAVGIGLLHKKEVENLLCQSFE